VVSQFYLGSIERIVELAKGTTERCKNFLVQEFGALFIANLIEAQVGVASIIDAVLPRVEQERGPSIGEYFLYAVFNRMVDSCSKRALPEWFQATAIQQIRPVDTEKLSSQRYWDKWDRVQPQDLEKIAALFFQKVDQIGPVDASRAAGEYWGKTRTVVVTYNPRTAAKRRFVFEKKLLRLQETLLDLRTKVRTQKAHWTDADCIEKHYADACESLHLPKNLYEVALEEYKHKKQLLFRKNYYRIDRYLEKLGKNILVTDLADWSTDHIVQASLDRYKVEQAFRQSKDGDLVSLHPFRHWTDSRIRCHIFTCVVALTYLRLIEIRLRQAGLSISASTAMENMRRLHSCLCWTASKRSAERTIEDPTQIQAHILAAFGYKAAGGVLNKHNG
jgi:hypothetical protein